MLFLTRMFGMSDEETSDGSRLRINLQKEKPVLLRPWIPTETGTIPD